MAQTDSTTASTPVNPADGAGSAGQSLEPAQGLPRHSIEMLYTEDVLQQRIRELGGEAIEVITGSHTPEQYREYADVARQYDFLASRGSDFHGPTESRALLGKLPALPDDLTPVWSRWQ